MKKLSVFLLLLSLLSTSVGFAFGQGRPRRVGNQTTVPQTTAPEPQTTTPAPPTKPPVLGGANYPNNRKPETQQEQTPTGPEEVDAGDIIRVNTTLITIPVSVMDRDGRYVPNLLKDDFRIWEDGVEQDVAFFQSVDKPFSVVLMLDTSPSTQFRLEDIQDAAITFVRQLRPDDRVMVVSFNDDINVLSEFTTDRSKLQRAIQRARTDDGTRLYDAVDMVMNQYLARIQGRKAIVLFTDGVDTTSRRADYQSNMMDAQELDALIYPVQYDTARDMNVGNFPSSGQIDVWGTILGGIFGGGGGMGRRPPRGRGTSRGDYELGDNYLQELANTTGGRGYRADSLQNMSFAFANVAEELRRQYSIGYYPKRPLQAGQRRMIRVRSKQPNLAVRARDSYVFNPSGTSVVNNDPQQPNAPVLKRNSH
ncbi:MAG TPA: VWA domain-containing protein [Pyrinomonadaceae bacterium]|nr:VWA domain-containing protein [Pyrinomonadaceae bacterium]